MKTEFTNEEMLSPKTIKFMTELSEDLELNEMNIKEQSLSLSAIKTKWTTTWIKEDKVLEKMRKKREQLIETYIKNHGTRGVKKFHTEEEARRDKSVRLIDKAISEQEEVVRYLKCITEIVRDHGFTIKNSIEIIKLEAM